MEREAEEAIRTWDAQKGLNTKIHLAVDAFGMPVDLTVTSGTVADSFQADKLISEIEGQYLLADRTREHNQEVYENRYQVENTFLKLKRWWGIATRYAKNTTSFTAAVQICCMYLWLCVI